MAHKTPKSHVGITARNISLEDLDAAEKLGIHLAQDLIKMGALVIINEAKSINEKQEMLSAESGSGYGNVCNRVDTDEVANCIL